MKRLFTPSFSPQVTLLEHNSARRFAWLLTAVLLALAASPVYAALDFYDSFNYASTNVQLSAAASSTWVAYTGGGANPTNIAGSLSYPNLATASSDNSVQFNGSGATGIAARNLSQKYTITNAPTLYYSLTFKVTSISTGDWGNTAVNWTNGSFMLGFNQKLQNGSALAQSDAAGSLLIRTGDPFNITGTANDYQGYQLGVGVTATTSNRVFDANHTYTTNDTLFIVVSYTFNSGVNDDVAKLYVNPVPGSLETDNTPVIITTPGALDVSTNQIQSFFLRNNSVEPANSQIDDLRVGTTWADVTPVGSPTLRIETALPNVLISWPTNNAGFTLESSGLSSTNWTTVGNSVGIVSNRFYVTNGASTGKLFFRLRK